LSAGDVHLDAAPKLARGPTTHQHPYRRRVLVHDDRRRLRFDAAPLTRGEITAYTG
jgi:hypothetical protein